MMFALPHHSPACQHLHHPLKVTPAEVGLIIRDLAPDNDSGGIDYHTFLEVLHAARQGHAHPGTPKGDSGRSPPGDSVCH